MLDHIGVAVSNYEKSKRFYAAALAPLGYAVVMEFGGDAAGLARTAARPALAGRVGRDPTSRSRRATARPSTRSTRRPAAGGRDNSAPRARYTTTYCGAFCSIKREQRRSRVTRPRERGCVRRRPVLPALAFRPVPELVRRC
jgi:catechol 2,3-dioxygenase-like lactoylglutathione lyase family enzyme